MTINEAINFVRTLLDEPKYEYYGSSADLTSVFVTALTEAASLVARECWYRGEKEGIRTLWNEATLTLDGNRVAAMPGPFLFIESVRSNYSDPLGIEKKWPYKYVSPAIFSRRRHRTPYEGNAGVSFDNNTKYFTRAEYTIIDGNIVASAVPQWTTGNKDITVTYIATPVIQAPFTNEMPLPEYMHGVICDKAAEILYRKEHPGDDRESVGGIVDVEAALYKVMRTPKR